MMDDDEDAVFATKELRTVPDLVEGV
jgi:hypothetical protein